MPQHGGGPAGPPPLPPRPASLASDRRELLALLLETRGLKASLTAAELDSADVPALVAALRAGRAFAVAPGKVVAELPAPAPTAPPAPAARPSAVSAAPAEQQLVLASPFSRRLSAADSNEPVPLPVSRAKTSVSSSAASTPSTSEDDDDDDGDDDDDDDDDDDGGVRAQKPAAALPQPPLELLAPGALSKDLEDELAAAAFQLHAASCTLAGGVPQAFTEFVRAQLGVAPQLADHVRSALAKWHAGVKGDVSQALSLHLPLALLDAGALPPKLARRWQRMQLAQLLCALPTAADALRAELFPAATDDLPPEALAHLTAALETRGWAFPVDPLGAVLYGALVRGQWDDLDESNGTPVEDAAGLFVSMRRLWGPLGVGQTAHNAHCVFSAVQRWFVGGSLQALRLARCLAKEFLTALRANAALVPAELAHVRLALGSVVRRSAVLLEDHHVQFRRGGDESFALWIGIACDLCDALALLSASPPESGLVAGMLCKSLTAAYARCRETALKSGADGSTMAALARSTQDLLDAEARLFTAALEKHEPAAACIGATHLQQLFATDLHTWLRGVKGVEQALPGLKASESLVARLQSCAIGGAAGEPPHPIDIAALAEPLAQAWVTARVAQSTQWMERALSLERWDTTATPDSGTTSAIDLVRAANEAAESFFSLQLQQAAPARALAQGVASTLMGYAKALLRQLGDPAKHIPPAPALTRYKQAATEVLLQEHARSGGADEPVIEITPTVDQLMAMHSSLAFIIRELPATEHSIQRQWLALARCPGSTLRRGPCDVAPVTGIFSETSRVLSEARLSVLAHVAHSVVFGHLRRPFIDTAYVFGTKNAEARLAATLLEPLNAWMARVCGTLSDDDRNDAAAAIMAAALRGTCFVLLNGGPTRTFLQDDCDALEADLEALRHFFIADGEGLPPEQVSEALVPASRLLDAMAQDTHHLIALHNGASATVWDKDTLLHVLCHRGDRTSSKYLKATLHTPKPIGFIEEKRQILSAMAHGRPH